MDWFQVISGVSFDSFRDPARILPLKVGDWFPSLRDFLAESELNIQCTRPIYTVRRRRINDVVLMETVTGAYTETEIKTINRVRIFLRVETLADCVDASGRFLLRGAVLSHETAGVESFPTRFWPRQARPGPKSWAVWRRFIRQFTVDRDDRTIQLRLREPLGEWLDTRDRRWTWSIDSVSNTVVHTTRITPVTFKQAHYPIIASSRMDITYQPDIISDLIEDPGRLTPTSRVGNTNRVQASADHRLHGHDTPIIPRELNEYFQSLEPWERQLLEGNEEGDPGRLLEWLIDHSREDGNIPLTMCHDGGARNDYGSFGWVISDGRHILWKGWGPAVGEPMQSFRAEAYGRLAAVCFLRRYIEFYAVALPDYQEKDIHMAVSYTDSKSLLDRLVKHATRRVDSSFDRIQNDSDVIFEIAATEKAAGITIKGEWVKGHQDDQVDYSELPLSAQLNVLADEMATKALHQHEEEQTPLPMLPLRSTGVYMGLDEGGLVTSRERGYLQKRIAETEMRDYLMDKYDWDMETWNMIDWKAFKSARSGSQPGRSKFVTKWTTKWIAVNRRTHRYGHGDDTCKRCGMEEDYDHLLQCPQRDDWRHQFSDRLAAFLRKQDTAPELRTVICGGLQEWLRGTPQEHLTKRQSFKATLSWHHAARGYFNKGLSKAQDRYYRMLEAQHQREAPESPKPKFRSSDGYTGHRWMTKLIRFIWQDIQGLWKQRNVEVHGEGRQSEKERENLERTVDTLYNTSTALCQHDRVIFDLPREEIKQMRQSDLKIWVRDASQIVKTGLKDARIQEKRGVQDIRNFFRMVNPLPAVHRLLAQNEASIGPPPQQSLEKQD
jgi:hypothetical protein